MAALFTALSRAIGGTPLIALAAALLWGVLSILLSPCHLASIPLIVGFIGAKGRMPPRRAFATSVLFALGILVTIGLVGAITAAAGRLMGDVGSWPNYIVAGVLLVFGLQLLGVVPMFGSGPGQIDTERRGFAAAFVLGLIFGIAVGPCTFAFMAPVLGATFAVARSSPLSAVGLLLAYGIGHCGVIVVAGTSTELVQRYLDWNERSQGTTILKKVCGVLVILGGVYIVYTVA